MWKRIVLLLPLLAAGLAPARDKPENWLEVRSQHFTVVTNANEKTRRRIADQFERMRSVFHVMFPQLSIETGSPIIVLAVKDEKDFRALEPQVYLAKGQIKLGGLFLRAPDKNYVLMRVDAEGEHPYAVVYHEYTHLLLSKAAEWLPLWLNEGLAEFYENTDIREKDVALGQPSQENILWLRENRLLPLARLFTVDTGSPYYHEENQRLHLLCGVVGADPLPGTERFPRQNSSPNGLRATAGPECGCGDRSHARVRRLEAVAIGPGGVCPAREFSLLENHGSNGRG
jgi:hypothetical protein